MNNKMKKLKLNQKKLS